MSGKWYNRSFRQREKIMESARVGKRGEIIVPARLRKRFGIEEGTMVFAEEKYDGILIRPAVLVPVERYSPQRKAEFLLSTATTAGDYQKARRAVRKLGLDPDSIPHRRPSSMDRLFLDANVLFSAAYRPAAGLLQLWKLPNVTLCSLLYLLEEARINLTEDQQRTRLSRLSQELKLFEAPQRQL